MIPVVLTSILVCIPKFFELKPRYDEYIDDNNVSENNFLGIYQVYSCKQWLLFRRQLSLSQRNSTKFALIETTFFGTIFPNWLSQVSQLLRSDNLLYLWFLTMRLAFELDSFVHYFHLTKCWLIGWKLVSAFLAKKVSDIQFACF